MHPFAVAAAFYESGTFEISEVPGDLWVIGPECLGKKTDTNLSVPHEVEQPKAGTVSQSREKYVEFYRAGLSHLKKIITYYNYALT